MWKVRNDKNDRLLRQFEQELILPLWTILIASKDGELPVEEAAREAECPPLSALLDLRHGGRSTRDALNEVLRALSAAEIRTLRRVYESQNTSLRKGLRPSFVSVPRSLAEIFTKVLYEKALINPAIWSHWRSPTFTRSEFHQNFRDDNAHVSACPYCDLDSINSLANRSMEHFLPRSKFPFISLNALNLIPSCNACNSSWEGKGVKTIENACSPFQVQVGEAVTFRFDPVSEAVSMSPSGTVSGVAEYLDLLGLPKRYGHRHVYQDITRAGRTIFETLAVQQPTGEEALEYLRAVRSGSPLLFALVAYIQEMTEYVHATHRVSQT